MLWALLIFILCTIPGKDIPHVSFLELLQFDKLVHAALFFILVLLLIRGLKTQINFTTLSRNSMIIASSVSIIYGGLLEVIQGSFFEGRNADIYDFIANTFGCAIALFLYKKLEPILLVKIIK